MSGPVLFSGDVAVDDRGEVSFVNDFDFEGVKRFYTVKNHRRGFVRAWHAHRREAKHRCDQRLGFVRARSRRQGP